MYAWSNFIIYFINICILCRAYICFGFEYNLTGEPDPEIQLKLRKASPIQYAHKVKAPTLIILGSKDRRVPYSQGIEYYHSLRANGVSTK